MLYGIGFFLICLIIGYLGRHRKMGFWGYFFGSILLTPIIGIILLAASDPKEER
jgi:TM2 domain-containing membrane protein YozV